MRLWSLYPACLDGPGLNGVWREGLLAQAVLRNATRGWRRHPQLARFTAQAQPVAAIGCYLVAIVAEARRRGYRYDQGKIVEPRKDVPRIPVTDGQLRYEFALLNARVRRRSPQYYPRLVAQARMERCPLPHPLFTVVPGDVEAWEVSYWRTRSR